MCWMCREDKRPEPGSWLAEALEDESIGFGSKTAEGFVAYVLLMVKETQTAAELTDKQKRRLTRKLRLAHRAYKIGMHVERTW